MAQRAPLTYRNRIRESGYTGFHPFNPANRGWMHKDTTTQWKTNHMGKNDSLSALLYPICVVLSSSGIMSKQDVNFCTHTISRAYNFLKEHVCCGRSFDMFNLRLSVRFIIAPARTVSAVSQQHPWTATLSYASVVRCFQTLFSASVLIPGVLLVITHQL